MMSLCNGLCLRVIRLTGRILDALLSFFFFQAEDGIRDLVRSRGLGDVYKRQCQGGQCQGACQFADSSVQVVVSGCDRDWMSNPIAVSYTHLTLPTSDLV